MEQSCVWGVTPTQSVFYARDAVGNALERLTWISERVACHRRHALTACLPLGCARPHVVCLTLARAQEFCDALNARRFSDPLFASARVIALFAAESESLAQSLAGFTRWEILPLRLSSCGRAALLRGGDLKLVTAYYTGAQSGAVPGHPVPHTLGYGDREESFVASAAEEALALVAQPKFGHCVSVSVGTCKRRLSFDRFCTDPECL